MLRLFPPLRHRGHATRLEIQHRFDAVSAPVRGPKHPGIRQSTIHRQASQHLLGTGSGLNFSKPHLARGLAWAMKSASARRGSGLAGGPTPGIPPGQAMSLPDSALLMW